MHKYGEQKWGEEENTIWGGIMCDRLGEIKAHRIEGIREFPARHRLAQMGKRKIVCLK